MVDSSPVRDPRYADHGERHPARATAISIAAAVGGFLFGFDTSVINGAVDSITSHFNLASGVTGFVVAIALIGSAVGAWFAGGLADRWGRPRVMLVGAVLFLVSSIGSGLAFSVWDLGFWRFIGGLGIGVASVIGPTYISEVAPGQPARPARLAAADGHRARHFRRAALGRLAGGRRRRRPRDQVVRPRSLALDVPGRRHSVGRVRRAVARHPGVAEISGGQGQDRGRGQGPAPGTRRDGGPGPGTYRRHPEVDQTRGQAVVPGSTRSNDSGCCRWSG